MREQLKQYVNLLFAGAADAEEIREEILQNTMERYDDLIDQGKSPEAAYRLAISGIGDVNEILSTGVRQAFVQPAPVPVYDEKEEKERKMKRAVAIGMYIASPIPLIALGNIGDGTIGLCLTLLLVAAATALLLMNRDKHEADEDEDESKAAEENSPAHKLKDGIGSLIWAIGLAVYLIISFATKAWYITWVCFPIIACVNGLLDAIIDLREARKHED